MRNRRKKKNILIDTANVENLTFDEDKPVQDKFEPNGNRVTIGSPVWKWARQIIIGIISESTRLSHRKRSKKHRKMMKELRRLRRKRLVVHELELCNVFSHMYGSVWKALGFVSGKLAPNKFQNVRS